ncbi:MAG: cyclic nucleotide-binding domain-containing protein [Vicinamibacteria bacterium]
MIAISEELFLERGACVFNAGDPGEAFFIVLSGRLEARSAGSEGAIIGEFLPGELFGERAVILDEPRSASVEVAEDARLLVVPRSAFERYFADNPKTRDYLDQVRRERRIDAIARNPLCSFLDAGELVELEKLLEEQSFDRGDVVVSAGDPGDALYFVLSGELGVWAGDKLVGHLGPPNSFGEVALLTNQKRTATIRVAEPARVLVLRRETFERFFLDNPRALEYLEDIRQDRRLQTLEQIPLFGYLSREELNTIQGLFSEVAFERDDVVCRAGDPGDAFYIVRSGQLEVWAGERGRELVDTIGPAGFFGEESLLLGEPRAATIRVSEPARLLVLKKDAFERFFLRNPKAVAYLAEVRQRRRAAALGRIPLFNLISPEDLADMQAEFLEQTFRKGDVVCKAGDESATFYVVLNGELEVWSAAEPSERLARLRPGDFFGELAVILGERRSATVIAGQRTQLLGLPKEAFTRLFMRNPRSLEYFARIMCQRLSSAVTGEHVGEGTVQIAVTSQPGLHGRTLVASCLAALLAKLTGANVLLVRLQLASPNERLPGRHLHLANVERSFEGVRRSFELPAEGPVELTLGIEAGESAEQYGGRISDLVNRLRADFRYQVFDLISEPRAVPASARDFADVLVEIVEQAEARFPARVEAEGSGLRRYSVVNLHNPRSRRIPISACAPFVLPEEPGLSPETVLANRRSPAAIPLWRLARKILGRSVGLALGGGAAFGISHLGVLQVLERNEIPVDLVVGCSIGSLVAISYAAGYRVEDMIEKAHEMGRKGYVASGLDFTLSKPGILGGDRLRSRFSPLLGEHRTFEDLLLPCRTVATDIRSGELVTIGRGSLEHAYRASIAVPMVLSPEALDGRVLVDGGVADPVPAETVRHMGADLCVAVPVVPALKKGVETAISKWTARLNLFNPFAYLGAADMPNSFDITMNSLQTLQHELGLYKVISADVSILPELSDFTWTDFDRSRELVEKGVEAAEAALPELRRLLQASGQR